VTVRFLIRTEVCLIPVMMRRRVCRVLLLPLAVPPEVCGDPPSQAPGPLRLLPLQGTPSLFIRSNSFLFPSFRLFSITFRPRLPHVSYLFLPFFSLFLPFHIPFLPFLNFLSFLFFCSVILFPVPLIFILFPSLPYIFFSLCSCSLFSFLFPVHQ
jgi:hypothetical protein